MQTVGEWKANKGGTSSPSRGLQPVSSWKASREITPSVAGTEKKPTSSFPLVYESEKAYLDTKNADPIIRPKPSLRESLTKPALAAVAYVGDKLDKLSGFITKPTEVQQKILRGEQELIGLTEENIQGFKELGLAGTAAVVAGTALAIIGDPLNLLGGGGSKVPKLVSSLKATENAEEALILLKGAGFADDVAEQYKTVFPALKTEEEVGEALNAAAKLQTTTKVSEVPKAMSVSEWKNAGKPKKPQYEPYIPEKDLPVIDYGTRPQMRDEIIQVGEKPGIVAGDGKLVPEKPLLSPVQNVVPTETKVASTFFETPKTTEVSVAERVPTPAEPIKKPAGQLPLPSRVFERLKAEDSAIEGDLTYSPMKLKEDAERAVNLVAKDRQKAFNIAMGSEVSKDITSTAVNIAMSEKALEEGNYALYTRLIKNRSLEQTRRGQEIVAEKGSVTDNSTSRYVKELVALRLENAGKNYLGDLRDTIKRTSSKSNATRVIQKEVEKVKKDINLNRLSVKDAKLLLDSLACV